MGSKVVSNTGPLLHLHEISLGKALNSFKEIYIAEEVKNELKRNKANVNIFSNVKLVMLKPQFKDVTEILVNKFSLDLGESQSIALALQEKADYFLTDDLDARIAANVHGIEAHGTVGIILRAFREKIISKEAAIAKVNELYTKSSLFITKELIDRIIDAIKSYKKE